MADEPLRRARGRAEVTGNSIVLTFSDDRVERWTPVGNRFVVEHWFPGSQFPAARAVLGIAERTHQPMYDAVWKTGELGITVPETNRLKQPLPSIADAARFYARLAGVDPQQFLAMANSFGIESKMRAVDAQILAMHVD